MNSRLGQDFFVLCSAYNYLELTRTTAAYTPQRYSKKKLAAKFRPYAFGDSIASARSNSERLTNSKDS